MQGQLTVKLTVRSLPSGEEVCVLFLDEEAQAYSIANALICSEEYEHTCILAVDWQGKRLFEVFPPSDEETSFVAPPKTVRNGNVIPFPKRFIR